MLLVALVYYISHSFIHSWYDMIWFDWFVIWKTKYKIPAIQTWTLDHYYYWSGIKFYIVALVVVNEKLQKKNFFFWIFPFRFLFHSFISLSETNQDFFFSYLFKTFWHLPLITNCVCVYVCNSDSICDKSLYQTKKKHWTKNLTFTEINKSRRNLNFGNQMKK